MVWLSSNCYYERHPRLWQRPLVILGNVMAWQDWRLVTS